jgi:hypothetical protein
MECEGFRVPGSRTHGHANNLVQFVKTHTSPLSKEEYRSILPSIQGLNQELSHAQVDTITRNERGRADYEIAAQNSVQHSVKISQEGNESELYQFTPGRRATRAHAAQSSFDPLSIAYVEEHGLGPAAEEFSQAPIDALAKIEERLEDPPSLEQATNLLIKHSQMLDAKRLADEELTKYRNHSRDVMRKLKEQRAVDGSTAAQRVELPDVTQTEEYKKLVDPYKEKLVKVRNRYLALEEQEERLSQEIGPARSEDIIAGSPVAKVRDALILTTMARYQVLLNAKPHLFFAKKIDNAIVSHDILWEDEQRASLEEDGHEGDRLERMLASATRYRQIGLENMQITDSVHDNLETLQRAISDELGKTRETIASELSKQTERYEMALEKIAQQLGISIDNAEKLISQSIERAAQSISESVDHGAQSVAKTVEDVSEKIMESMKASGDAISEAMKGGNEQIRKQLSVAIGALNDQKKLLKQLYDATEKIVTKQSTKGNVKGSIISTAAKVVTQGVAHGGMAIITGGASIPLSLASVSHSIGKHVMDEY